LHINAREKIYTGFSCEILKKRDNMEELGVDGRIVLKWASKK
jgi:hypothetical protein